jgi:hypothetical protein
MALAPRAVRDLYERYQTGDLAVADALHFALDPLVKVLFVETNPAPTKHVLAAWGIIGTDHVRKPLVRLTAEGRERIAELLAMTKDLVDADTGAVSTIPGRDVSDGRIPTDRGVARRLAVTRRVGQMWEMEALLCGWRDWVTAALLENMPRLRYLGVRGTSTHRVETAYAAALGIEVRPIYRYGDAGTAEFVAEQLLNWVRTARRRAGEPPRERG